MAHSLHLSGISYEQLRGVLVQVLARKPTGQLNELSYLVASATVHLGMAQNPGPVTSPTGVFVGGLPDYDLKLSAKDHARVHSIMWDLLIEGVIRPGNNDTMSDLPFFHVTEFGASRLTHDGEQLTPYDPDGYITKLQVMVPTLDPIIITYLNEASRTFRINCLLSSAVMLGCAAEKAMLLLIEAYACALSPQRATKFREKSSGKLIKRQVDEFDKMVESHLLSRLPGDVAESLDTTLSGIFELIRTTRNDAGHPTGRFVERDVAFAHLRMFPSYVKKVYSLIQWLSANSPLS